MEISNEELKEKIKELEPWRQNIDFGNGITTENAYNKSRKPENRWKYLVGKFFPDDMTGLSVLDIGCNTGYYSIQFKKRGANRVVAIDYDIKNIRQASFLSEWFNTSFELIKKDILEYVLTNNERFDYVLFSRVFYHLKYPNLVLDRLAQMTTKRLIFLTEVIGEDEMIIPKGLT